MPRINNDQPKLNLVSTRVANVVMNKIQRCAEIEGLTVSEWVRLAVIDALKSRGQLQASNERIVLDTLLDRLLSMPSEEWVQIRETIERLRQISHPLLEELNVNE